MGAARRAGDEGFTGDRDGDERQVLGLPLAGFADVIAKLAEVVRISGGCPR